MQKIIERLKFWWNHNHDWVCYPDKSDETHSEKYYWHRHQCDTPECEKRISVLNADCELYQSRIRRRVR